MTPYYDHAGITIYHGDCREILPQFPDKSFDREVLWVLGGKEDHREAYDDDETPEDELWEQLDAAADLM